MERARLGRTELQVSRLGFGAAPIGYLKTEQQTINRILSRLLDQGINVIDTAAEYPGSETAIGRAVSSRRDRFITVSKCGQEFDGLDGEAWSPQVIAQTIDRSLRRLQTDYLDVMLLHSCDAETLERGDALGALVRARESGKIRFAGYSGDNETAAYAAALPDIAVVETSVNICDQTNIDQVLPIALQHDVGVVAKRPIANAAWKPQDQQEGIYVGYAAEYTRRFDAMDLQLADLGLDNSAEWSEVALRFTLSQSPVHTAIVGTTKPNHVEDNLKAVEKGPLSDQTISQIRAAFQQARLRDGGNWKGQT